MSPRLLALATAVPPHVLDAPTVARCARAIFGPAQAERLVPILANSGIERRHSCVPPEWYPQRHGWAERSRLFADNAVDLACQAAGRCLDRARVAADQVDAVVAVSTSGICTPSLDALVAERMGLRRDVMRLPVFGLGCAGGVLGLARAGALARAMPGARVLLLVVELCGLTFRPDDDSKSNLIATALFGDGAAAALVGPGGDGPVIAAWGEHTWADSLDVMGWHIEDDGFGVLFSRDIPALVRERFRPALDAWLDRAGIPFASLAGFCCHPGGAKVVAALEESLGLPAGALAHERAVLRDYGNMSAATVLFVLERALTSPMPGRRLATALGPGFTAGFLVLDGG
ncbi:MAG: type III polyketide synthase [Magnetospirillum sp.]|nr:type III polyketide synthase [Magnetospirillum sp.]